MSWQNAYLLSGIFHIFKNDFIRVLLMIFEFGVIFLQGKTTERANVILRFLREIKPSEGSESIKNQNTKYGSFI